MLLCIYGINHFNTLNVYAQLLVFIALFSLSGYWNYFELLSLLPLLSFFKTIQPKTSGFLFTQNHKASLCRVIFFSSSPSLFYSLYSHSKHFISIFPPCFNFETTPLLNNKKNNSICQKCFLIFLSQKKRNCWASICSLCCFATTNTTVHSLGALLCWLDFWSSRLNLKVITNFSFPYKYMFYDINVVTCSAWTEQAHDQLNSFSELQQ